MGRMWSIEMLMGEFVGAQVSVIDFEDVGVE